MKNKIIDKKIDFGFGVKPDKTEWVLLVEAKKPLSKDEYIEALELWIEEFKADSHDLLSEAEILGWDLSSKPEGEPIH